MARLPVDAHVTVTTCIVFTCFHDLGFSLPAPAVTPAEGVDVEGLPFEILVRVPPKAKPGERASWRVKRVDTLLGLRRG